MFIFHTTISLSSFLDHIPEPVKPLITRPDKPTNVPLGDGSPEYLTIGDNVTALVDTPIEVTCTARGVPAPVITWSKDGNPLESAAKNSTLILRSARLSDAGRYTCTATNAVGKDSVLTDVKVLGKSAGFIVKDVAAAGEF